MFLKVFTLVCMLIVMPVVSYAAPSVAFQWVQAPEVLWGTKIYIGTNSGVYDYSEDAGIYTTEYTLDNVLEYDTTYYFSATHYDLASGGESPYAEELVWTTHSPDSILFNPFVRKKEHPIKSYIIKFIFKQ